MSCYQQLTYCQVFLSIPGSEGCLSVVFVSVFVYNQVFCIFVGGVFHFCSGRKVSLILLYSLPAEKFRVCVVLVAYNVNNFTCTTTLHLWN